ncbi:MAG: GntR family transcriptional regulator [Solirubrobacterales bacterium]
MDSKEFQDTIKKHPFAVLKDVVFDFLLKDIIMLRLTPGQKISEANIASELGISRSPVRMAIDKLISERLVIRSENKVLRVAQLETMDYLEICNARKALEGSAAFFAANNITEEEIINLERLTKEYKTALSEPSLTNFELADHQFHTAIVRASNNGYLIEMYDIIQLRILRYRYYARYRLGEKTLHSMIQNDPRSHFAIFSAIANGYSTLAKNEIELHIDGMKPFVTNLNQMPDL